MPSFSFSLLFSLLALLAGPVGCSRRAPGPDECHALAVEWVRAENPQLRAHGIDPEEVEDGAEAVLERATECLTTPYDRELVDCVVSRTSLRACATAFEQRHTVAGRRPRSDRSRLPPTE
jgi:hypothetical protein